MIQMTWVVAQTLRTSAIFNVSEDSYADSDFYSLT
jgi:hypothetical protein